MMHLAGSGDTLDKKLDEKGAVAIIVIAAITVILGFGAIVIDGGQFYYQKARLGTTADAAVLAGARALGSGATVARQTALDVALANGASSTEIEITVDEVHKTVSAHVARTVSFGLARVLNVEAADVTADSAAGSLALSGIQGAIPLGVVWQNFSFGQISNLKVSDGTTGNYGALALGGTGAANYRENLSDGYPAWLRVGQQILTEPGNMAGATRSGVQDRIQACHHQPPCTYDHYVSGCPRVVTVPIITALPNGRGEVTVLGFAAFFLQSMGDDGYVTGRFIRMFAPGEVGPAADYGLQTVKLLR